MKIDLVCKGGGVKGIALIGAIAYLEEQGYEWERLAGTSAGAIVTSLLAVGYKSQEVKEIMFNLNYKNFSDKNILQSIPLVGQIASLFIDKGLYAGDALEDFLEEKFKAKNKTTFKDISKNGVSKLKVIATDVTKKELLVLPDDLVKYNINPMEFPISKAVRMSLGIPLYFNPVKLKNEHEQSYIVDGGLVSNFPIWVFDIKGVPRWPTFGLYLCKDEKIKSTSKNTSLFSYMFDIVETVFSSNEDVYLRDKDSVRTINIPTLGVKTTDFSISQKKILELYNSGYLSAKTFLKSWNFSNYISKYRN